MRINPTTSGPRVSTLEKKNLGRIAQIIGPILDVAFPPGKMPNIYNALVVKGRDTVGQQINVTCEVQQLLGNNRVRAVAMSATDVGGATLGRIFNVLGELVDNLGPVDTRTTSPIHRSAPAFIQLDTKFSIFETGIQVVDLLAPYRLGGKIELLGLAGWKDCFLPSLVLDRSDRVFIIWSKRIRTFACRYQKPMPYHLAILHTAFGNLRHLGLLITN
ncbi:unnamed protein product, partial [Vitis vinifera]